MSKRLLVLILLTIIFLAGCTSQNNEASTKMKNEIITEIRNPSFSHDDSKIVFESEFSSLEGTSDIRILDLISGEVYDLIATEAEETTPSFSPDGKKVAFSSNGKIMTIDIEIKQLTNLTGTEVDFEPQFSPNGQQIIFTSRRDGYWNSWIMNEDGTNQTVKIEGAVQPKFSEDGEKIVFVGEPVDSSPLSFSKRCCKFSGYPGDSDITMLQINDGIYTAIETQITFDGSPEFSPDGTKIIYHSTVFGQKPVIKMVDINSGASFQLITEYDSVMYPSFSHDGKKLAYVSDNILSIADTEDLKWERVNTT